MSTSAEYRPIKGVLVTLEGNGRGIDLHGRLTPPLTFDEYLEYDEVETIMKERGKPSLVLTICFLTL